MDVCLRNLRGQDRRDLLEHNPPPPAPRLPPILVRGVEVFGAAEALLAGERVQHEWISQLHIHICIYHVI